MQFSSFFLSMRTTAGTDILDITAETQKKVAELGAQNGLLTLFICGSTAALSTIEFESGCVSDLTQAIERLLPETISYEHDKRWGDGNGYSHVRAALFKPNLTIPVIDGALSLGTWQQIVLLDFDNRPRTRKIVGQLLHER
ncbi:MAG: secondary thiamine-phosphate synthase enzyme YjbQ [Myxococcales bacterium]|nr:secondary thiamine-phosphate synthase enzyme YjbQ [Myxococcales bacterium]